MSEAIIARWQDWAGSGIEHLVLKERPDGIAVDAVFIAGSGCHSFAARYCIRCDVLWRLERLQIEVIGTDRALVLAGDGLGNWTDGRNEPLPDLRGAIDVDISASPFTNTLPIRRLRLAVGESQDLRVVYVRLPDLGTYVDHQRYTCLERDRRYRYESIRGDFVREIETDDYGLVVTYPGLFRRLI